jgi:uncharacterized protein (TIGR02145 family)
MEGCAKIRNGSHPLRQGSFLPVLIAFVLFFHFSSNAQELKIGNQIWAENNLNTVVFHNGDSIFQARSNQEWIDAASQGIPAWCYANDINFANQEKLYNIYAIRDDRELAPEGWKVPSFEDFKELMDFYGNQLGTIHDADRTFYAQEMNKLRRQFRRSKNDSLFLSQHDDYFDPLNLSLIVPKQKEMILLPKNKLSDETISKIEQTKVNRVLPAIMEQDIVYLIKVADFRDTEYATVRHILFQFKEGVDTTEIACRADSVLNVILEQDNFEEMVERFSDDPGSVTKGGVYSDFTQGVMIPSFNDFSFGQPTGAIGIVRSVYGIHIIEVLDQYSETRPVIFRVTQKIRSASAASTQIKSKEHWEQFPPHGITNNSFLALPSGYRNPQGYYLGTNHQIAFWTTSTWEKDEQIFISILDEIDSVILESTAHSFGFSVRCIKDN